MEGQNLILAITVAIFIFVSFKAYKERKGSL